MKIAALSKLAMIAAAVGVLGAAVPRGPRTPSRRPARNTSAASRKWFPRWRQRRRGEAQGRQADADPRDARLQPPSRPPGEGSPGTRTLGDFIKQWDEGSDSFAKDPPNANLGDQ